jgi:hypothetical protein
VNENGKDSASKESSHERILMETVRHLPLQLQAPLWKNALHHGSFRLTYALVFSNGDPCIPASMIKVLVILHKHLRPHFARLIQQEEDEEAREKLREDLSMPFTTAFEKDPKTKQMVPKNPHNRSSDVVCYLSVFQVILGDYSRYSTLIAWLNESGLDVQKARNVLVRMSALRQSEISDILQDITFIVRVRNNACHVEDDLTSKELLNLIRAAVRLLCVFELRAAVPRLVEIYTRFHIGSALEEGGYLEAWSLLTPVSRWVPSGYEEEVGPPHKKQKPLPHSESSPLKEEEVEEKKGDTPSCGKHLPSGAGDLAA